MSTCQLTLGKRTIEQTRDAPRQPSWPTVHPKFTHDAGRADRAVLVNQLWARYLNRRCKCRKFRPAALTREESQFVSALSGHNCYDT